MYEVLYWFKIQEQKIIVVSTLKFMSLFVKKGLMQCILSDLESQVT